ncbi:hypothetical protein EHW99_3159 [Erwinia amylovora]|uniref:Uncharacterized protein n=3 Tax=Erwinia amylovora TaxID=552 RepID=A0A831A0X8_ERWAM|nr:hypothetical protein EaACW_0424 [Erwinia amylovora ACW56400]QJQ55858.1 hypothetical protein EHX00_3159 [Erwinia amylovora]CBA19368.1 hypothetical protein predicted by Glimmer/Critica [Erwinia amylovora CFBP1430]CBX79235.1 hypothetical protein predicted by Glimmer/Critica [Erwinia amylovora ATCC BAA-2158]CCO77268.1 hypothetical protein BN432_0436 [Erwinia amylovora Ea356]CCO81052.1 hypothetical protein BN433_0446 [Erwinia amylovora Ea266]CCO84857.1 hypothetical protein BN434_0435 [Erwinia a
MEKKSPYCTRLNHATGKFAARHGAIMLHCAPQE